MTDHNLEGLTLVLSGGCVAFPHSPPALLRFAHTVHQAVASVGAYSCSEWDFEASKGENTICKTKIG